MEAEFAVIGGGVAGLAAVRALRAAGRGAVLLEARARLGGRVWTLRPPGWAAPVEQGAEFIHGAPRELMDCADTPRAGQDWSWSEGRLQAAGEFGGGAWELLDRMAVIRPPAPDRSFAAFLADCGDAPAAARQAALGYIEGFEAADPERISVYSLNRERAAEAAEEHVEGPWPRRPRGGYGALIERLAAEAGTIWLNTRVRTVAWRRGAVEITAEQEGGEVRLRARRTIVALPLSLLQRSASQNPPVRFEPGLDAKRQALAALVMGGALRVTLRLREPIWEQARDADGGGLRGLRFLFGPAAATGHFPTWWTASGAAQITGWAAGRHAWALAGRSQPALRGLAVADLAERLGLPPGAVEAAVIEAHLHDWQTDEFALGGYSYATAGGADGFAALAAPLEQTLYFAGEATDAGGRHATVQGAWRSGERAAQQALAGV